MSILRWDYPESEHANPECEDCEGDGRIYNNADKTCGQWVECECVSSKAMVNIDNLVRRLIKYMKDNPEDIAGPVWRQILGIINSSEKFYPIQNEKEE